MKEVMITLTEFTIDSTSAVKIMSLLKKHEPEIHKELKEALIDSKKPKIISVE